ncbi:murein biosynthesis integral membrane protein MurJ [Streptomyces sp. IB2014 016-6]|uniref:murein biosynthesis integral membrane protein MurJ n=1 Tax=Streptomyces sp. IB2014 016-6 TaxID=2517818 RepID=UPI0011CB3A6D|nr:murein biosynthesis integral membrane protein MurJ [Streptomyces sp. IB2014 016-6]TXL92079.1 murein biosynthesis integral membrane protein MurJ [Streptomyces sp. IB2014 016-6]
MNAPYDGDRGQGAGGDPAGHVPPQPPAADPNAPAPDPAREPYAQSPYAPPPRTDDQYARPQYGQDQYPQGAYPPDPYARDAYAQDPYRPQGPVSEAHPPPPGAYPETMPLYQQPPAQQYAPDPRVWAQPPPPEPDGPSHGLPYGDDPRTTQFTGVDELVTRARTDEPEPDAFAHLFRDQEGTGRPVAPAPEAAPAPPPAKKSGGRASGLLKSSAVMAAGTLVSRLTGFVRSALIVAALGAATLGDTFQLAITLPTMIYILTIGGGLNSVFVPQLIRAMKDDEDGGEAYANRLLTLVVVILGSLTALSVFAAPVLVRLMSVSIADNPAANDVAVVFVRYCLITIFFMGVHVVMGQILNARGRFGAMMWTPVLNNIIIIATLVMFIWVYGTAEDSGMTVASIPPEAERLLGVGVVLGLTVQALAMIPYLRETGFRIRLRFDWRGHGLGKAAKLAKWTVLFVLANQAGVLVVSQLSTAAGVDSGTQGAGYIAYSNAQLIWGMPQAIITVSVMAALLPRLSRSAHDGDTGAVRDDISQGLRNSAVAIVPVAFSFVALGIPMCTLIFGSSGIESARSMGYMLMAFGLGLIPFSVQYVVLRAFYAYEDTRTPFYNTVIVAVVNAAASAVCFLVLPSRWAVVGMAASYGLAYAVGVGIAWRRLKKRLGGDLDGSHVLRTYARLCLASVPGTIAAGSVGYLVLDKLGSEVLGSFTALAVGGIVLLACFFVVARKLRIEEMNALVGMVRGRLGR